VAIAMQRRKFITVVGAAALWPLAADAQQSVLPVIGFLSSRSRKDSAKVLAAFARGLGESGLAEGKNISVEYRFAEGALDRLPELAADLVHRPVNVLVAVGGANSALAAKRATSTLPVIFVIGGDPVRLGLAPSLSRPSGNVTGITIISADLAPKRLALLLELVPNATSLAALTNPNTPEGRGQSSDMLTAALGLGLNLRLVEAGNEKQMEAAFAGLAANKPDALLVGSDPVFDVHRDKLVALVAAAGIPAIWQFRDYTTAGGLMSYDPDIEDAHRTAGNYVGRVLKGAKPADLPIQQPTKFHLVINLKAARALGLTVPATLLARADEVIE
jgi:putative ABC transport system substrate-binding protein